MFTVAATMEDVVGVKSQLRDGTPHFAICHEAQATRGCRRGLHAPGRGQAGHVQPVKHACGTGRMKALLRAMPPSTAS